MAAFDIIEYMSGLTGFVLDERNLKTIALERGVSEVTEFSQLTQRDKDLLRADILLTVVLAGDNIPSFQRQHGQFSTSTGQQTIKSKDDIIDILRNIYGKYKDEKLELVPTSCLQWMD